jgi:parallel beta-helix repeat protein
MDGSPVSAGAEVYNNSHWGIGVEDDGTGTYIYNNTVFDCPAMGIVVGGSGTNVTVESNTVARTATGLGVDNAGINVFRRNNVTDWVYTEDPFAYGRSCAFSVVDSPNTNITENIFISTDTSESIGLYVIVVHVATTQIMFTDNIITSSTSPAAWNGIGLKVTKSSGSIFARNNIQATSGMDFGAGCEENFVYDNDFSNCTGATFDMGSLPYFWNNTALDGYNMLNATVVGSGSTTINSVSSATTNFGHQFIADSNASVMWTPDPLNIRVDYAIDDVNQTSTISPANIIMDSNHTVTAYFEGATFTASLNVSSPTNGTLSGPDISVDFSGSSTNGTNPVYRFNVAFGNGTATANFTYTAPTSIVVNSNVTGLLTAYLETDEGVNDTKQVWFTVECIIVDEPSPSPSASSSVASVVGESSPSELPFVVPSDGSSVLPSALVGGVDWFSANVVVVGVVVAVAVFVVVTLILAKKH